MPAVPSGVIGDRVWSPDDSLRSLAEAIREHRIDEGAVLQDGLFSVERQQIVELADLERAFVNPLDLFLSKTLRVNTYREDLRPDDATLPLATSAAVVVELARMLSVETQDSA